MSGVSVSEITMKNVYIENCRRGMAIHGDAKVYVDGVVAKNIEQGFVHYTTDYYKTILTEHPWMKDPEMRKDLLAFLEKIGANGVSDENFFMEELKKQPLGKKLFLKGIETVKKLYSFLKEVESFSGLISFLRGVI